MWILSHPEGKTLYLLPRKQYVVGRKNADLILEGDQSVSRKHAVIIVGTRNNSVDASSPPTTVKLVDKNSKYGTFVKTGADDWINLSQEDERLLISEDIIRFGLLENKWKLVYGPLIVTSSNMHTEEKKHLRNVLASIDGHITNAWENNCTHLTMNNITLTIKALCAMVCCKPIVLPKFWSKYLERVENNREPPDYKKFIPPLNEPAIDSNAVSFAVNEGRRHVFEGKHFVFASQIDLKELGCLTTAAGATAAAFEEYSDSFDQLCQPHVIVVCFSFITSRSASTQMAHLFESFQNATSYLKSRSRRVISDQEIGFAILYCSTEKYCNPDVSFTGTSSGNLDVNLEQCSRVSLDFSSQAVSIPTEEISHLQNHQHAIKGLANPQQLAQMAENSFNKQSHSGDSTCGFSLAKSGSESVLIKSPIKIERRTSGELKTSNFNDNQKRVRGLVLDDTPAPKRPAAESPDMFSMPSSRSHNVSSRNMSIKLESGDDDLFGFPNDSPAQVRARQEDDEVDEFTFTDESKVTVPRVLKQEKSPNVSDVLDADLFGTLLNTSLQNVPAQLETCKKMPSEVEIIPSSTGTASLQVMHSNSGIDKLHSGNTSTQKRKNVSINEVVQPPLKKSALSLVNTSRTSKSDGKSVFLHGFLNTTSLKTDAVNDLADNVLDMILIDEGLLVVREKTRLTISFDKTESDTAKNYKKFRKILPVNRRILPRIIGGNDLYVYKADIVNKWNDTVYENSSDDNLEMQKDDWNFPALEKTASRSMKTPARKGGRK